jgi:hypothetical protein
MQRRDVWGLATVIAVTVGLIAYRAYFIEPREWGTVCVGASPPMACMPRAALIWLQRYYLWGTGSLVLGLLGFAWGGGFGAQLAAVILGVAAIENYNATWGAIGLALGAWGWLRRDGWAANQPASR